MVVLSENFKVEEIPISELKNHPRNYREHPDDQLKHLISSIQKNGIYKNIVISKDNTILAGHGVVKALKKMGFDKVPVIRLNFSSDDSEALKILVGDNEIGRLGEINDIELSNMLKQLRDKDVQDLLGTGYDELMLANLLMVSRASSEIKDFNEAAEWVGMTDFERPRGAIDIVVNFRTEEDRISFFSFVGQKYSSKTKSIWWPEKHDEDTSSLKFE